MQGQEPRFLDPKTMKEAIVYGASTGTFPDIIRNIHLLVNAYLATHFAVAYLKAESPGEIKRIKDLWESITRE